MGSLADLHYLLNSLFRMVPYFLLLIWSWKFHYHFYRPQLTFGAKYCFYRYLSFCSQEGSASKGGLPPGEASHTTGYGRQTGGMHPTGMHTFCNHIYNKNAFQVGCVPPAAVAMRGGCLPNWECLPRGGVSAWGVSAQVVGCLPREVSARHTPWTEWQTHEKNITLPQLLYGQ